MEQFILKDGRELTIRLVQPSDYEAVQIYIEQMATENTFTNQYPGRPRKSREDFEASILKMWMLVILDGEKVVGVLSAHPHQHVWEMRVCSYGIHMLKAYHRNGLGHHLMNRLEEWARQNNMHRIEGQVRAVNTAGLVLYLKHGFVVEGCRRDCVFINGEWFSNYFIAKILD